jgi:hypothetical protein
LTMLHGEAALGPLFFYMCAIACLGLPSQKRRVKSGILISIP